MVQRFFLESALHIFCAKKGDSLWLTCSLKSCPTHNPCMDLQGLTTPKNSGGCDAPTLASAVN